MTGILFCGGIFRDEVTVVERFPSSGETVFASEYSLGFGGKAANQSVATKFLLSEEDNVNIFFMGKVGQDDNGDTYEKRLRDEVGIRTELLQKSLSKPTGLASIVVENPTGENKIVLFKGANEDFIPEDVKIALEIYESVFSSLSWIVVGTEIPLNTAIAILKSAQDLGIKTILNFAPIPDKFQQLESVLKMVTVLCVNEIESKILSGLEKIEESIDFLLKYCPFVIITLGSKGAVFKTRTSDIISVEIPHEFKPNLVVDTTGAGDSFIGSLAFYIALYLKDFSDIPNLKEIIKRSCIIAAQSVTRKGTQSSYFSRATLPKALFSSL